MSSISRPGTPTLPMEQLLPSVMLAQNNQESIELELGNKEPDSPGSQSNVPNASLDSPRHSNNDDHQVALHVDPTERQGDLSNLSLDSFGQTPSFSPPVRRFSDREVIQVSFHDDAHIDNLEDSLLITHVFDKLSINDLISVFNTRRSFRPLVRESIRMQKLAKMTWENILDCRLRMQVSFEAFSALRSINDDEEGFVLKGCDFKVIDITQVARELEEFVLVNSDITDLGLVPLAQRCNGLRFLQLGGSRAFSDEAVERITFRCQQLTFLDLRECTQLGPRSFTAIARHCHNLTTLLLSSQQNLTDDHITAITGRASTLEKLWVNNCRQLTDLSLIALSNHCVNLRNLGIYLNDRISMIGMSALLGGCPLLEAVDLRKCPEFPASSRDALEEISIGQTNFHLDEPELENIEDAMFPPENRIRFIGPGDPEWRGYGAESPRNNQGSSGGCCAVM